MDRQEDAIEDLVELACQYLQEKRYPDDCSATKKRQIRQRAKKFCVVHGELFYKHGGGQVSLLWSKILSTKILFLPVDSW